MSYQVFTSYDPTTGELGPTIGCPEEDIAANTPDGHLTISGEWRSTTHYVVDGVAVERPQFGFADQTLTLNETLALIVPAVPCQLRIDGGDAITLTDDDLTFQPEHAGVYELAFSQFPYIDQTITVTVNAN